MQLQLNTKSQHLLLSYAHKMHIGMLQYRFSNGKFSVFTRKVNQLASYLDKEICMRTSVAAGGKSRMRLTAGNLNTLVR